MAIKHIIYYHKTGLQRSYKPRKKMYVLLCLSEYLSELSYDRNVRKTTINSLLSSLGSYLFPLISHQCYNDVVFNQKQKKVFILIREQRYCGIFIFHILLLRQLKKRLSCQICKKNERPLYFYFIHLFRIKFFKYKRNKM